MSAAFSRPLDVFPAIRSREIAEIENLLSATYGARRFLPGSSTRSLAVHANHWQSQAMAISYCEYGAPVEVQFPEADFFRQQFALRGGSTVLIGGKTREIGVNRFCIVPPGTPLGIRFRPGFEQIVLRLGEKFLNSKFSALHGCAGPMRLDLRERLGNRASARLRRLLDFFCHEVALGGLSEVETRELEQSIAVAFLVANREPGFDTQVPTDPGASQQRAVEDYIQANWNQPLSIEALSSLGGISNRAIFYHFRKRHGMTPMAYVKEVRLQRARLLLESSKDVSVTDVALGCGFGNLGHFAAAYRKRFGELPRETRRRST